MPDTLYLVAEGEVAEGILDTLCCRPQEVLSRASRCFSNTLRDTDRKGQSFCPRCRSKLEDQRSCDMIIGNRLS